MRLLPGSGPKRRQLADQLRARIRAGELAPGTQLPSSRTLAASLGVSRGVAVDAYAQLRSEGWIAASATRRSTVCQPAGARAPIASPTRPRWRYDLTPTSSDLAWFPRVAWAAAVKRAIDSATIHDLTYGDPRGPIAARAAVAVFLARTRGARVTPDEVLFTSGFTHGLHLVCRTLAALGRARLAVEDPCPDYVRESVTRAGMAVISIPVDSDGIDVDRLAASDADAVLTTPSHQYPTGARMSPVRRADLIAWAQDAARVIIEDDYDGDFLDRSTAGGSLQAAAPDRVVLIGSTARSLAPALRIGWMTLPVTLRAEVEKERWFADSGPPALEMLAIAELIECGAFDRHLRRARAASRGRMAQFLTALDAAGSATQPMGIPDGLHVSIRLPDGADDRHVSQRLARAGVKVEPLSPMYFDAEPVHGLVIGISTLTPAAPTAIASLIDATVAAVG